MICGGLWSFAVVCGGLRWFVVVCLIVIPRTYTQQKLLLRAHYTTKVFNAAVVSNLVALVAIIVSYPVLLLTNNNMMMISVRRICLKK